MKKFRVLMVCLGNICRSPTAQGVFEQLVEKRGLNHLIEVDSAGTSDWHIGDPPDPRSIRAAQKRGYDLSHQRGRLVSHDDFFHFDYILAMDAQNLRDLQAINRGNNLCHLGLFLDFSAAKTHSEVPDPYRGGAEGFELVLDLVEDAAQGLLDDILAKA